MNFRTCSRSIFLLLCIWAGPLWAYPEFIGYGYSSCLTCHYNGHGGGPLNDYGRALWSGEIASRALFPKSMSDEDIAGQSGFFGSLKTPAWLRPHVNYRGLELWLHPGGADSQTKFLQMQAEAGITVQTDEDGRYLATSTWGHIVDPSKYGEGTEGLDHFLAKEYYLRLEIVKTWWFYIGMMEKVFGLRNIDHTSYQRTYQGFNVQNNTPDGNSQSQGVVIHKIEDQWELALNYFIGNPHDQSPFQQKGFSFMGEYEVGEKKRLGGSVLSQKSDVLNKDLMALHYRQGLSKGSAFLFELGMIKDTPEGADSVVGSYGLVQSLVELARGYNLNTGVEHYNKEFKSSSPDLWKFRAGILAFPLPRLEMRVDFVNERQLSRSQSQDDSWEVQGQVHVSL